MTASPAPALQELRALLVLDALPAGCIAHLVADDASAPHLRAGELAIVDTNDRTPIHGELFLIGWDNPTGREPPPRSIMQPIWRSWPVLGGSDCAWMVYPLNRWASTGDGPFRPGMLEEKIVSRVVGILAPAFEEPKRLPAAPGSAS